MKFLFLTGLCQCYLSPWLSGWFIVVSNVALGVFWIPACGDLMSSLSMRVTVSREIALPPSLKGVLLFIVFSQVHEDLFRNTGRVCVHVSVCECV